MSTDDDLLRVIHDDTEDELTRARAALELARGLVLRLWRERPTDVPLERLHDRIAEAAAQADVLLRERGDDDGTPTKILVFRPPLNVPPSCAVTALARRLLGRLHWSNQHGTN